jgi:hypothetical protein
MVIQTSSLLSQFADEHDLAARFFTPLCEAGSLAKAQRVKDARASKNRYIFPVLLCSWQGAAYRFSKFRPNLSET